MIFIARIYVIKNKHTKHKCWQVEMLWCIQLPCHFIASVKKGGQAHKGHQFGANTHTLHIGTNSSQGGLELHMASLKLAAVDSLGVTYINMNGCLLRGDIGCLGLLDKQWLGHQPLHPSCAPGLSDQKL